MFPNLKKASSKLGSSSSKLLSLGSTKSRKEKEQSPIGPGVIYPQMMSADLGGDVAPEVREAALREKIAELERVLAKVDVPIPRGGTALKKDVPPLAAGATAAEARAHACDACCNKLGCRHVCRSCD